MNKTTLPPALGQPTRVRYGVLGFACALSMITYLDRVCFGHVAPLIQKEFDLSQKQVGLLFTAFALAYAAFEVPSGWLGDIFGPRRTLLRIVLWWSSFTALTGAIFPTARWPWVGFAVLLGVRFLFGMGEAGAYPNIARAFHNWFPFEERGFAQGAVWMAGRLAGGLTGLVVLALLIRVPASDGGTTILWRHSFWIFGSLGVVWCVLFWFWFRDQPEQHPGVNQAELNQIRGAARVPASDPEDWPESAARAEKSTGIMAMSTDVVSGPPTETGFLGSPGTALPPAESITDVPSPHAHEEASHAKVPWGRLLSSPNLWALCLMYFCASYGWYFNITWLPKYLATHYGVTEETYGFWTVSFFTGAPLLFGSVACLVGGLLTDTFIRRTGNRKWGRRLFGVVGHGACAGCYFLGCYFSQAGLSVWLFVLAIALAAFWNDLTMGSAWASCLDIGRKYSGIVSGCMNTIGNLGGAAAGYATGWVLEALGEDMGWTVNFLSFSLVYVVAALLWLLFDSTKPVAPEAE
jgi:MFS family permease